jgi:UDP-N-acetylmuramoyl-tripeptide--D-alanyl-D-alanine ligase
MLKMMRTRYIVIIVLLSIFAGQARSETLTRELLDQSLALGRQYFLNHQQVTGSFDYEYNIIKKKSPATRSEIRQTGTFWGVTLIHVDTPSPQTADAISRALKYYDFNSVRALDGRWLPRFAGTDFGKTGVAALLALALIDVVRAPEIEPLVRDQAKRMLAATMKQLMMIQRPDKRFYLMYRYGNGKGFGKPSPYADGEVLLAMIRAARYAGYEDLKDDILKTAEALRHEYIISALAQNADSKLTKGFYQWGSMAFYEIHAAGWDEKDIYAKQTIKLAYWMIDVHQTLKRGRNTGYAYEGICSAWELARLLDDRQAMQKFSKVINTGLYKLTTWQVGSPIANQYLQSLKIDHPLATGGVMNTQSDPVIRCDTVQHQMHAVILARRWLYKKP